MARAGPWHKWTFASRFRRHAFGWRSPPAIARVKEAVSEISVVARHDKLLAAEGAVVLIERLSPALENVDSSSGAIGSAVNHAIDALVEIIASAPADPKTRDRWLERLWEAYQADQIPYIETLGDHWGELCGSPAVAAGWADRLIGLCRMDEAVSAIRAHRQSGGHLHRLVPRSVEEISGTDAGRRARRPGGRDAG
jgi:hypothetical protein